MHAAMVVPVSRRIASMQSIIDAPFASCRESLVPCDRSRRRLVHTIDRVGDVRMAENVLDYILRRTYVEEYFDYYAGRVASHCLIQ